MRRNCFLEHVTEEKIKGRKEVTGRRGRRRKQLLDEIKQMRGRWELKETALSRTLWRSQSGRRYGPVVKTGCRENERVMRSFE
jgi:hypothetical protein